MGRGLSNDFRLTAEGISRSHARIVRIGDDYLLFDLDSKNGTFLNGRLIHGDKKLSDGDVIELGRTVGLRFEMPATRFRDTDISKLVDISSELNPAIMSAIDLKKEVPPPDFSHTGREPVDVEFLRKAYDRLALLYEVNSSVSSSAGLDESLERIANIVLNLKRADRVAILLIDEETGTPRPAVFRERKSNSSQGQIQVSRAIVEKTISEGLAILSGDALSDPRFSGSESLAVQNVQSVMCAPLKRSAGVIGAIYVDCLFSPGGFDEEDLRLLMAISNEASIVVENAYSFREIEKLNRNLEEKVISRTAELERALADLKNAQAQLVQSEKMAAVGEMVAGVAHEVNNPVNAILNGVESLARYVGELREINDEYAEVSRRAGADMSGVEEMARGMNFDAHMELLDDLLSAISEGAGQTAEIVEGLRSFSRTGEAQIKEMDINNTLDKTLKLLSHRLKDRVGVSFQKGEVPVLRCYASQMGQVFLNLLNNAREAIVEKGMINLRTWCDPDNVHVSVSDDGQGIAPDIGEKIFDPFFTTKVEGENVGLGLSIALAIVKRHGGEIEVAGSPGEGATFTVTLPRAGIQPERGALGAAEASRPNE